MERKRIRFRAALALVFAAVLAACQQAPITGRSQLILIPESQETQLGLSAYRDILSKSKISRDPTLNRRVQRVGRRIAKVSPHPEYDWRFTVIDDVNPNAFALPGGKVGVNTGLFKVARNDAQLAAVMAHEVAHAIARHGSERISQQILVQGSLLALGVAASTQSDNAGDYVQLAAAATLAVVLPFSRGQESEADHIGLLYMARAGYDPRQAIGLWQNFDSFGDGRPPEFLSTHPSPGTRINRLRQLMPRAMNEFQRLHAN